MEWGLIIAVIELCLSIACMVMGGVHWNECENQAAIFLLVDGGVTLLIAIGVISLFCLNHKDKGICSIGVAFWVKLEDRLSFIHDFRCLGIVYGYVYCLGTINDFHLC